MDNGQKFYVMMNLKLFHACAFCSPKDVVMYSDFRVGISKIPHSFGPIGNGIKIFAKKINVVK